MIGAFDKFTLRQAQGDSNGRMTVTVESPFDRLRVTATVKSPFDKLRMTVTVES